MARPKTIYSLKGIFTKLLDDAEKQNFIIPAYQRGFKWSSSGSNSQIALLMSDIYSAFESGRERYYLQFLTLKMKENSLEVIDGQQRLTALSILFCILNHLRKRQHEENFVVEKLKYQVRQNFIDKFIYKNIDLVLETKGWEEFIGNNANYNNQDVYFLYQAAIAISEFLKMYVSEYKYSNFYSYLCDNVFLIVNLLESDVDSEKVFINVNKGVKLQDEDLVKGLLITKIPFDDNIRHVRMTEIEVNEIRANVGRQWDDITKWASREEIRSFFIVNASESNLGWLIKLAFFYKGNGEINPLFNYLDKLNRTKNISAAEIFSQIRNTMLTLNDWYCEPEFCNLLGYILHSNNNIELLSIWLKLKDAATKGNFRQILKKLILALLPINEDESLKELNYEDSKQELFDLFLILDVAKFLPIGGRKQVQYDFGKIKSERWSIEHIFPQNPGDFKNLTYLSKEDLDILQELMPKGFKEVVIDDEEKNQAIIGLYNKIKNSTKECKIEESERENLNFLLSMNASDLHKIGNLALLEKGMNSGLSNHFFDEKRKIIVQKVSSGEFVPYHTYDVFSKLVIQSKTGLHVWSKADINIHEEYIKNQINEIIEYLKS
jgi:uncharacterized protein with ParB-like and HNH nuclease domain